MKIIGITGGVGSGKSTILTYLKDRWGAFVVLADEIGRAEQQSGKEAFCRIVEAFGEMIVAADGQLDRRLLSEIIYQDHAKRELLESIVHPVVKSRILELIAQEKKNGTAYFVIEAAVLIEAGYTDICDELWFIYADKETRIRRLALARGYTRQICERIIDAQLTDDAFKQACNVRIDNSHEAEKTFAQIDREFFRLKEETDHAVM